MEVCSRTDSGKSSLRRRRAPNNLRKTVWACTLIGLAGHTFAQEAPADQGRGAAALDRFLAHVEPLTAEFRQELWTSDQRLVETSAGMFALARPNRFLWRYTEPSELLVVANGEELWT